MFLAVMIASRKNMNFTTLKFKKNHTHFLLLNVSVLGPEDFEWFELIILIYPPPYFFPQQTILPTLLLVVLFSKDTNSLYNSLAVSILKERLAVPTVSQQNRSPFSQLKCLLYSTKKMVHCILLVPPDCAGFH